MRGRRGGGPGGLAAGVLGGARGVLGGGPDGFDGVPGGLGHLFLDLLRGRAGGLFERLDQVVGVFAQVGAGALLGPGDRQEHPGAEGDDAGRERVAAGLPAHPGRGVLDGVERSAPDAARSRGGGRGALGAADAGRGGGRGEIPGGRAHGRGAGRADARYRLGVISAFAGYPSAVAALSPDSRADAMPRPTGSNRGAVGGFGRNVRHVHP
ncbi:hypothetical protein GCM10023235_75060 [Kitasatospora terrestris]|uniref:Uncharacterized protein n=1 Tax=Kitasatospora terrestris TaxID=258051 RepID=A0ABP9ENQ5_9ACTN